MVALPRLVLGFNRPPGKLETAAELTGVTFCCAANCLAAMAIGKSPDIIKLVEGGKLAAMVGGAVKSEGRETLVAAAALAKDEKTSAGAGRLLGGGGLTAVVPKGANH